MGIISVRLNAEEQAALDDAAKFYRCSISTLLKRFAFEKLEDEYGITVAKEYLEEKENGTLKTRPIQELCKEVGIDWDSL